MQVLEVYHKDDKTYFLLSRGVIDAINTLVKPGGLTNEPLGEDTECNWTVSAANLRAVFKNVVCVSDATNLMGLILSLKAPCKLCGLSWQELKVWGGGWYDLKPQYRETLEQRGITDGTFILQGV